MENFLTQFYGGRAGRPTGGAARPARDPGPGAARRTPRRRRLAVASCAAPGCGCASPQRGDKRALAETVKRNAEEALTQHRLKRASDLTARSAALSEICGHAGHGHGPAAHRVHRRLPRPGHRRGRLAGGVRGRPAQRSRSTGGSRIRDAARRRRRLHRGGGPAPVHRLRQRVRVCRRRPPQPDAGDAPEPRLCSFRPTGPASTPRPADRAGSPTRRNCWSSTAGRRRSTRPRPCWPSSASPTSPCVGLAKRLEEVWLPGRRRPGDPAAHQRGAVPAAASPRRGAPVRDHLPPAASGPSRMTVSALGRHPGLGQARRSRADQALRLGGASCARPTSAEIAAVPGFGPQPAAVVHDALHAGDAPASHRFTPGSADRWRSAGRTSGTGRTSAVIGAVGHLPSEGPAMPSPPPTSASGMRRCTTGSGAAAAVVAGTAGDGSRIAAAASRSRSSPDCPGRAGPPRPSAWRTWAGSSWTTCPRS